MKKLYKASIQEPYKSGYEKASNGKWYYEEYWVMSHIERRKAYPAIRRRNAHVGPQLVAT
tara:strand:+ start:5033 stop:5212 length:180 start_codon:yes stop_codon:yes gene_type:complete